MNCGSQFRGFENLPHMVDVPDTGLGGAKDVQITDYVRTHRLCVWAGGFVVLCFCDTSKNPSNEHTGLAVTRIPRDVTLSFVASSLVRLVESFFNGDRLVSGVAGKLAIVGMGCVRPREREISSYRQEKGDGAPR